MDPFCWEFVVVVVVVVVVATFWLEIVVFFSSFGTFNLSYKFLIGTSFRLVAFDGWSKQSR